jgi:hypothetical protein
VRYFLLLFLLPIYCTALEAVPPKGWRFPTDVEMADEPLRNESPTKYAIVVADFNGDGKLDYAYLFKSTEYSGEGLLVQLSSPQGYVWKVITQTDWGDKYPSVDLVMGIDLAKPGKYETACSEGALACEAKEQKSITLKRAGIWHFKFESGGAVWYWDLKMKKFLQVWISD